MATPFLSLSRPLELMRPQFQVCRLELYHRNSLVIMIEQQNIKLYAHSSEIPFHYFTLATGCNTCQIQLGV